jgi:hypothetical protein
MSDWVDNCTFNALVSAPLNHGYLRRNLRGVVNKVIELMDCTKQVTVESGKSASDDSQHDNETLTTITAL